MTRMEVKASEHGQIRLFTVDLPPDEVASFSTPEDETGWPLQDALGATRLDEDFVELFDVADLEELGLTGYMTEGLGIAETEVRQDAPRLNAINGHVLILFSSAFAGIAQTLTPRAPLRWIGTYSEQKAPVTFEPLPAKTASGTVVPDGSAPNNPHLTVLWAVLALPILALIVGAVIYGVTR